MESTDFSLHERFMLLREKHGLSQSEMAEALGIPFRTYQNIEYKRTKDIGIKIVIAFSKAMAISLNDLVYGENQSPAETGPRGELNKLIVGLPDYALPDAIHRIEILLAGLKNDKSSSGSAKK